MSETRKIFQTDDGRFWMEILAHESEQFKDQPDLVRWFGSVPTSEVSLIKKDANERRTSKS